MLLGLELATRSCGGGALIAALRGLQDGVGIRDGQVRAVVVDQGVGGQPELVQRALLEGLDAGALLGAGDLVAVDLVGELGQPGGKAVVGGAHLLQLGVQGLADLLGLLPLGLGPLHGGVDAHQDLAHRGQHGLGAARLLPPPLGTAGRLLPGAALGGGGPLLRMRAVAQCSGLLLERPQRQPGFRLCLPCLGRLALRGVAARHGLQVGALGLVVVVVLLGGLQARKRLVQSALMRGHLVLGLGDLALEAIRLSLSGVQHGLGPRGRSGGIPLGLLGLLRRLARSFGLRAQSVPLRSSRLGGLRRLIQRLPQSSQLGLRGLGLRADLQGAGRLPRSAPGAVRGEDVAVAGHGAHLRMIAGQAHRGGRVRDQHGPGQLRAHALHDGLRSIPRSRRRLDGLDRRHDARVAPDLVRQL